MKKLIIKDRDVIMTKINLLRDGMTHWMTIGKRIKLYIINEYKWSIYTWIKFHLGILIRLVGILTSL